MPQSANTTMPGYCPTEMFWSLPGKRKPILKLSLWGVIPLWYLPFFGVSKFLKFNPQALLPGDSLGWHLTDHLVQDFDATKPSYNSIATNPQLVNINYNASATNSDWIHLNSIDYNPQLDQILLSSHNFDEIWIIDHSTTTSQPQVTPEKLG
jgi:hypothetical protein